jgi:hypothetical protein
MAATSPIPTDAASAARWSSRMAVSSFGSLAAAALLGVVLAAMGSFARHVGAFAFLMAFG